MSYTPEIASKLFTYFNTKLNLGRENAKGWQTGDCPHCGKKSKFGINLKINRTNCFSCETRLRPLALVKYLEGFKSFYEVYTLLKNFKSFRFDIDTPDTPKYHDTPEIQVIEALPKEFTLIGTNKKSIWNKILVNRLKGRGISEEQALYLGIGYCSSGDFEGRAIIPFYREGKIIYFHAWAIISSKIKYKNPSEESFGIGKGQVIYNHDALNTYDRVWMFEGVFNAITIGSTATATGGKQISPWQMNEYIKSPCTRIIIAWDDDGYVDALKVGLTLAPYKKVKVLLFPKGLDANDLGKKATKKLEKNTPYMNYSQLYKLYLNERAKHSY